MGSKKFSSDTIMSVSAIIIATISIVISIWEGIETRRHNRLSVQPRMELYYDLNYDENLAQLTIKNNGLGPAIIEQAIAVFDDSTFMLNNAKNLLHILKKLGVENISVNFDIPEPGNNIMPNESKNIFSVNINDLKEAGVNKISLLNNVDIIINYKSLYEEDFVAELKRVNKK